MYLSKTELNFRLKTSFYQFLTLLLPGLRKMLTLSISNTYWCHSVGVSCYFLDTFSFWYTLADVIACVLDNIIVLGRCYCHVAILWQILLPVFLDNMLYLADVIAMFPCCGRCYTIRSDVITCFLLWWWCCYHSCLICIGRCFCHCSCDWWYATTLL